MTPTVYTQEMMTDELYDTLQGLTALVDADSIVYRSGFAADGQLKKEYKEAKGGGEISKEEYLAYLDTVDYTHIALGNAKETLKSIQVLFKDMKVFLTGKGNYRDNVASILQYKGNRDPTHKPKYYKELREYFVKVWHAEVVEGMEADDKVSILQWDAKDKSTIIVSIDKDLANTPGHHYNQNKHEYRYVTLPEANLNFWKQVGMGDGTDNIPGLKGVGIKTVEKWAAACEYNAPLLAERVRTEYANRFGEDAPRILHENATLLWMQRVPDINYDGSKISDYEYQEYEYGNEEDSQEDGQHLLGSEREGMADVERADAA